MSKNLTALMNGLGEVASACEIIESAGRCEECPLFCVNCVTESSLYEVAEDVTKGNWDDFFDLAKETDKCMDEADYIAYLADNARKGERDEQYIDSLYGI